MILDFLNNYQPTNIRVEHMSANNCPPPGTLFVERQVLTYELDFITWGQGQIITDQKAIDTIPGRLFVRSPGLEVKGIASYHCYFITFDLVDKYGHKYDQALPFSDYIDFGATTLLEPFFEALYTSFLTQGPLLPFIQRTMIGNIFVAMVDSHRSPEATMPRHLQPSTTMKAILRVRRLIDQTPEKHYTLDDLATIAGLSPYHFSRLFKKQVEQSPIQYMNSIKLLSIKRQLLSSDQSIKTIMLNHGFVNESNFYYMFKSHVGMTPLDYRKSHQLTFINPK